MNYSNDIFDFDNVLNQADRFFDLKDDLPQNFSWNKVDNEEILDDIA